MRAIHLNAENSRSNYNKPKSNQDEEDSLKLKWITNNKLNVTCSRCANLNVDENTKLLNVSASKKDQN